MGDDPAGLPLNLICFDEIDALCRSRGSLSGDTSGVRDSVVNQARVICFSMWIKLDEHCLVKEDIPHHST